MIEFNKNKIIEDYEFNFNPIFNIKLFLEKFNSPLITYKVNNTPLYTFIELVCTKYNINPKIIILMMEVQTNGITQSLVKDKQDYILNLGVGVKSNPYMNYVGIENQILQLCNLLRKRFNIGSTKVNITMRAIVDDLEVTPTNIATYTLYTYLPYVGTKDLYKKTLVKDHEEVIQTPVKQPHRNKFLAFFGIKETIIKCDHMITPQFKTPFGMLKFKQLWETYK